MRVVPSPSRLERKKAILGRRHNNQVAKRMTVANDGPHAVHRGSEGLPSMGKQSEMIIARRVCWRNPHGLMRPRGCCLCGLGIDTAVVGETSVRKAAGDLRTSNVSDRNHMQTWRG